jgi:transposase-like protein
MLDDKDSAMNEKTIPVVCPVCGAEMEKVKTVQDKFIQLSKFKCTCGHSEDRKEEGSSTSMTHSGSAIEGFKEFPS